MNVFPVTTTIAVAENKWVTPMRNIIEVNQKCISSNIIVYEDFNHDN